MVEASLKYNNLDVMNKKSAEIFITNRMFNEGVPFLKEKDAASLLGQWNPTILLENGLMKSFSNIDLRTIDIIVIDRIQYFKKSKAMIGKNKIIKGCVPYLDLNTTLNVEPDEKTIKEFEKLLILVNQLSEEEKQKILKSK